jgi:hypothetical protein
MAKLSDTLKLLSLRIRIIIAINNYTTIASFILVLLMVCDIKYIGL